jgi:alanine dehydrogenase
MKKIKSIGLPKMHKEKGERRVFLPSFIEKLNQYELDIFLEKGYGNTLGYSDEDYKKMCDNIFFTSNNEVYQKDLIVVLRAPNIDELRYMNNEALLLSMLHYDSKPDLLKIIKDKKINSFSLDSIRDDNYKRMVVSYELTAWGGVLTALNELKKRRNDFYSKDRDAYKVTILGMGNLGKSAGESCFKYIEQNINDKNVPGVVVCYIEKDSIHSDDNFKKIFAETDLLIDATKRLEFSEFIIPNDLISYLKEEAIILDLTADPYDETKDPIQVKAIEGIPYGTLDNYVIEANSSLYDSLPSKIKTKYRRLTVSCNGWPGVFPEEAMKTYENELIPFIDVLVNKGADLSINSNNLYERALVRATKEFYEENDKI